MVEIVRSFAACRIHIQCSIVATKEDKREKSTTTSNKCYLSLTSNHNNMKFRINKFIIKNEKLSNARAT